MVYWRLQGFNPIFWRETLPLVLMQLQITHMFSVSIVVIYKRNELNMHYSKLYYKTKQKASLTPEHKKITNRTTIGLTTNFGSQALNHLRQIDEESPLIRGSTTFRVIKGESKATLTNKTDQLFLSLHATDF